MNGGNWIINFITIVILYSSVAIATWENGLNTPSPFIGHNYENNICTEYMIQISTKHVIFYTWYY